MRTAFTSRAKLIQLCSLLLLALVFCSTSLIEAAPPLQSWPLQAKPGPDGDPQQDPASFPRSKIPPQAPKKQPHSQGPAIAALGSGDLSLTGGWRLQDVRRVSGTARELSEPGFPVESWYEATVPGTVLTTLVNEGVYPEPTYGLNNLAIPESLSRTDWWYRNEFTLPESHKQGGLTLSFKGINYTADVWLNGRKLGEIRGAFMRGTFNLDGLVHATGPNVLLVRVSPPPHPGIPHEESLAAGSGVPNGGSLCLDGPTFFCTEGWDWIPGIRDRCTGIWQEVVLHAGGPVLLGDAHIKTELPLPATDSASIWLSTGLHNRSSSTQHVKVRAAFEGVSIEQELTLAPGEQTYAKFDSGRFPALQVKTPRLWWPNGYGSPELYHLSLSVLDQSGRLLDQRTQRFGIRHITYELSARDEQAQVRRLEFNPSAVWDRLVIDKRHAAINPVPGAWVPSLAPGALADKGLSVLPEEGRSPFLVIRVNGVPIICKGGNWGLDEALKRCDRARLEPYFRLQRDANFTMIRNWCGQNTEEVFYDLADEYGLMVWNDFWLSTQDWNQQPLDLELFLRNASDVIQRFRNHPSIVLWCGRNEGVPPPALNEGLDELVRRHDGSRYYQPSSRDINLLDSGPWTYGEPVNFFNRHGLGFSTELGLPNVPVADAIRAMMPLEDQWPLSDTWAYHDWHQAHHGEVATFMKALSSQLGEASSLEDFCRKAQLLNYDSHRALFEGLNAHLWKPSTGRLMWMSHPAWGSTEWQLYTADYDTNAAWFAVRKACEPLHIQLNLDTLQVAVANTTRNDAPGLQAEAELLDLTGKVLWRHSTQLNSVANSSQNLFPLLADEPSQPALRLVRLRLCDQQGRLVSDNVYWLPRTPGDLALLNGLPLVSPKAEARFVSTSRIHCLVSNPTQTPVLLVRPSLRDATGARVLPAWPDDGCFSLMPGESRSFNIDIPTPSSKTTPLFLSLDGWNLSPSSTPLLNN